MQNTQIFLWVKTDILISQFLPLKWSPLREAKKEAILKVCAIAST